MEKKVLFSIVLTIFALNILYSQEEINSEKKAFKTEDSKLYYNQNEPLYFWISTSATDNSQDVLLTSTTSPQYSNPMYLDMEGYNTLRTTTAANPITKKALTQSQVIFEIWADGLAPKTTSSFKNSTKYISGNVTYYGNKLKVELKSTDLTSGVEDIYYSVNKADYQKYSDPIEIEKEGEVNLKYFALDNCGNQEETHEISFSLDKTPPVTIKQINGEQIGNVISQNATISLESTDNITGVKATYYSIDDAKPVLYTKPLSAVLFLGGEHTLTYYAIDNVDNSNIDNFGENTNTSFSYDFVVDKNGPTAELNIVGDKFVGKQLFVSSRSKFEVVANDDFSKIETIKYGINTEAVNDYKEPLVLETKSGISIFKYFAQDEMGNIGKKYITTVYVDNTEPDSYIEIGQPQFFYRDTLFISSETAVKIITSDSESGLAKTEYSIDNAAFQTYKNSIKLESSGFHKINFKATDNVNNAEVAKESSVFVDNLAPEIFVNFSIEPIREETKDGVKYSVYPTYTKMYLSATDKSTGEEEIYYSINGSTSTKYTSADLIFKSGLLSKEQFYTVKVTAKDKLGNQNEKTISFYIAKK